MTGPERAAQCTEHFVIV